MMSVVRKSFLKNYLSWVESFKAGLSFVMKEKPKSEAFFTDEVLDQLAEERKKMHAEVIDPLRGRRYLGNCRCSWNINFCCEGKAS